MTDITVVMATYKQAKYLPVAMVSVMEQVGTLGLRVIMSKDDKESERVLNDQFETHPTLASRFNRGYVDTPNLWNQRQVGLNDAVDEYVSFFDSDDVMLPGWLEKGLKVAEEISSRGKVPIVGPSYRMVDEKLFPIQDVILPEFTMDKMMEGSIIPDFSITKTENLRVAFEAGVKTAHEHFTPQYSMYATWLELLKRFDCEVKLLPDIGFLYRQHRGGMHNRFKSSKRASKKNVDMVKKVSRYYFPEGALE